MLSTLLYGAESWTVYMAQAHSLNAYMMRHLRQMLCVRWWHRIPDQDILMKTNMPSMYETLIHHTSDGQVISSGSTSLGCQSKSFTPSSRKDIEALAGQNSVSKIPSKETWQGKGFRQGAGTKKLTTDHSGELLYEGSRHQIRWTASSSSIMDAKYKGFTVIKMLSMTGSHVSLDQELLSGLCLNYKDSCCIMSVHLMHWI